MSRFAKSRTEPELFSKLLFGNFVGLNVRVGIGSRDYWVQKPRTNAPNPYRMIQVRCPVPPTSTVGADKSLSASKTASGLFDNFRIQANNSAYKRMMDQVTEVKAELALTIVDHKRSATMITKRGEQLLRAVRAVKRLDYYGALRALNLNPDRGIDSVRDFDRRGKRITGRKNSARARLAAGDTAGAWLELSFGWKPLLQDIYNASKILSNTPPTLPCVGKGRINFVYGPIFVDDSYPIVRFVGKVGVRCQVSIRCTSPNLSLLNQLGLDNPAYVLWDVIPFSFVADWFIPVGNYLSSWTDFVGLEVLDPFTTVFWDVSDSGVFSYKPIYTRASKVIRVDRTLGVPNFELPTAIQYTHGLWKQVTSTALIIQKLTPALRDLDRKAGRRS